MRWFAFALLPLLAGCDPIVHVGWEEDFNGKIDDHCVERALKSVSTEITRDTYVSDGFRGFPRDTIVTQFYYRDPITYRRYELDFAALPGGKTHYIHEWSTAGRDISVEERAQLLPFLKRANGAVARTCSLAFEGGPSG